MPLLLLSEVVRSIVVLSEYFEETSQFQWMHETLLEIYKSFEKEDEVLWSHLMYGVFYAASKIELVSGGKRLRLFNFNLTHLHFDY